MNAKEIDNRYAIVMKDKDTNKITFIYGLLTAEILYEMSSNLLHIEEPCYIIFDDKRKQISEVLNCEQIRVALAQIIEHNNELLKSR